MKRPKWEICFPANQPVRAIYIVLKTAALKDGENGEQKKKNSYVNWNLIEQDLSY